jgi:CRISPR-associated protein Cmr6
MARGTVSQWNGSVGRITDAADGARVFFGDRALRGLGPGDIQIGTEVEFERVQDDRGPAARNVRRAGTELQPPSRPAPTRIGRPQRSGDAPTSSVGTSDIPVPPNVLPLPASLRKIVEALPPATRHPGLQLDKYSRGGEQTEQKTALAHVAAIAGHPTLFGELRLRRDEALRSLAARAWCRTTAGPLTLHLARASAMENAGICLHPIYGFAYLPGSGLKGMARAYAETVANAPSSEVEAVFGNKPREPVKERQRSGAILFHDAWPATWPRLVVDIVNNHHAKYYQGDDPPGDWDSPVPVYFLAVAAGQEFSFALGKRRTDVADKLLELAQQWLDGALTVLGCGAKTVAGYGYFSGAHPAMAARPSRKVTLELVAPAFLAGANQQGPQAEQDCDLRPATLRGLLRWWWRTLHAGFLDVRMLRNLEAALWGDTAAGGAIQIVLEGGQRLAPRRFDFKDGFEPRATFRQEHGLAERPNNKTTQGLFYAAYGMDEKSRGETKQRHFLDAAATWNVQVTTCPARFFTDRQDAAKAERRQRGKFLSAAQVLEQAEAALWLLATYGAAGSKARKGFGSLQIAGDALHALKLQDCKERATGLRRHLGLSTTFDPASAESSSIEQALFLNDLSTPWDDPWKVLDEVGFVYQSIAQDFRHNPAKVALGLPRKFHGPRDDDRMRGQENWQPPEFLNFPRRPPKTKLKDARHASPVHIHVAHAEDGRLVVRAIAFPARYLPDLESSRDFLGKFLDQFERRLRERMTSPSPQPLGRKRGIQRGAPPAGHRTAGATGAPARTGLSSGASVDATLVEDPKGKGRRFARHDATGLIGPITNASEVPADKKVGDVLRLVVASLSSDGRQVQFRYKGAGS